MTPSGFGASTISLPLDRDGVWREVRSRAARGGPALFLDRDGVVVEEVNYLCRVEDVVIVPGAATLISAANRRSIPVVLVTNQAGIGRGLYGWAEFIAVQNAVLSVLAAQGARLDAVYACPHHAAGKGDFMHPDHPARKPNPGMILRAAEDLALDLQKSWLVGDRTIDIEAARRAGLAGAMQVMTGYGATEWARSAALATESFEVRSGPTISDALTLPILCP
jgi:D-glycero-D-manno-heptose 1,7-bisphosphate phosphatase